MDHRLIKIYESMCRGDAASSKPSNSLSNLYEMARKTAPATPITPVIPVAPATAISNLKGLSSEYDKLISKATNTNIKNLPVPKGDYPLGDSGLVNSDDLSTFSLLFPLAPSTKDSTDSDSKGSGKGEIAMYWLLSKSHAVRDSRDRDAPDLKIDNTGIEVKSYPGKGFKLGKFKVQTENRKILSMVFGLNALFNLKTTKRPVSVDVFNSGELISAFSEIKALKEILDKSIKKYAYLLTLQPIRILNDQITFIENELGIGSFVDVKENEASAILLKKLLSQKLETKPGFGGYYVNVSRSGQIDYYKVDADKLNQASPDIINKITSASSGELQVTNAGEIFIH